MKVVVEMQGKLQEMFSNLLLSEEGKEKIELNTLEFLTNDIGGNLTYSDGVLRFSAFDVRIIGQ